jgi:hypothetical protein
MNVEGKTSVLFGAIGTFVFVGILLALVMVPQSAPQAQSDMLRKTIDEASRAHNQVLGLLAGPTVKVSGKLPPIFEKGSDENITVLEAGLQNTVIPERLEKLKEDITSALGKAPEARKEVKAAAYTLLGQVHSTKAQYYLQSVGNASRQIDKATAAIDTGIISAHEHLVRIGQLTPHTRSSVTAADKMKSESQSDKKRIEGDITARTSEIATLQGKRSASLTAATTHANKASELQVLSAIAEGEKKRKLQEQSFAEETLAHKATQNAEDTQIRIDRIKSTLIILKIELTSAMTSGKSGAKMVDDFALTRKEAKAELDGETQAISAIAREIIANADALVTACDKAEADQASAIQQYVSALEAIKQLQKHASGSGLEGISGEAGVLMGRAWASLSLVSSRQAVAMTGERIKALWETAALKGTLSKTAGKITAFAGKIQSDKDAAAGDFATAAALYEDATGKMDSKFKWNYQCRELQARRARHWLTGDADDKARADLLKQSLEELKGFPYVDDAL